MNMIRQMNLEIVSVDPYNGNINNPQNMADIVCILPDDSLVGMNIDNSYSHINFNIVEEFDITTNNFCPNFRTSDSSVIYKVIMEGTGDVYIMKISRDAFDILIYQEDYKLTEGCIPEYLFYGEIEGAGGKFNYTISKEYLDIDKIIGLSFVKRLSLFNQLLNLLVKLENEGYLVNDLKPANLAADENNKLIILGYSSNGNTATITKTVLQAQTYHCDIINNFPNNNNNNYSNIYTGIKQSLPGFVIVILELFFESNDPNFAYSDPWFLNYAGTGGYKNCFGNTNKIYSNLYVNKSVVSKSDVSNNFSQYFKNLIMDENDNHGIIKRNLSDKSVPTYNEILTEYIQWLNINTNFHNPLREDLIISQNGGDAYVVISNLCLQNSQYRVLKGVNNNKLMFLFDKTSNVKTKDVPNPVDVLNDIECNYYAEGTQGAIYIVEDLNLVIKSPLVLKITEKGPFNLKKFLTKYKEDYQQIGEFMPGLIYCGNLNYNGLDYDYLLGKKYGVINQLREESVDNKIIFIRKLAELMAKLENDGKIINDFKPENIGYDENFVPIIIDYDNKTINTKMAGPATFGCNLVTDLENIYSGVKITSYAFALFVLELFFGKIQDEFMTEPWQTAHPTATGFQYWCRSSNLNDIYNALYNNLDPKYVETYRNENNKYETILKNILLNKDDYGTNYNPADGTGVFNGLLGNTIPTYNEIVTMLGQFDITDTRMQMILNNLEIIHNRKQLIKTLSDMLI